MFIHYFLLITYSFIMRRPLKKKREPKTDPFYNSTLVEKFINTLMWDGKKSVARNVVYGALDLIKQKTKSENPLEVFEKAVANVSPLMEVRSRRVGGANYQVPREVKDPRRTALAMRWLVHAVRSVKGKKAYVALADELIAASHKEGSAYKKREDTHKMAESNKAFAHFAW